MNPLYNPWAVKEPLPKKTGPKVDPPYLGLRTELAKAAAQAPVKLVFEVRGLAAGLAGQYKIEYSEGAKLRYYLHQLRLTHAATYAAIYDQADLERGRRRLSYVPTINSRMLICSPKMGSAIQLQRTNVDAERVATNMGRKDEV